MVNRLAHASSPYLRQHADNPVDWWEWGDEAFERARETDRPVLVSIGYSTCHWCHVMAHESFADEDIARQINDHFVAIKVDREERPDVDALYMEACQALTGHGGWPLNVFVTPDGKPFFAGTYWPPADRAGMPGLPRVLRAVHDGWVHDRDKVLDASVKLTDHIAHVTAATGRSGDEWDDDLPAAVVAAATGASDREHGGFGREPKFPQAMFVDFLVAHHLRTGSGDALDMAVRALDGMARGGIFDHVGGGFARYSVDARWQVPHFEKMLYDNALLLRAYSHAAVVDGAPRHARVARRTARWLLDELRHPDGGFYSAWDADSPGGEGAYYTWTAEEFDAVVARTGEDPKVWREVFGVVDAGNWADPHGHAPPRANVLWRRDVPDDGRGPAEAAVLAALREHRSLRVPPHRDEKVLTSWNALAIAALAEAGALLEEPAFVDAARAALAFLDRHLVVGGVLHHTWSDGHGASVPALLEDIALLAQALLVLYESHPDPELVDRATALVARAEAFADGSGGWYASSDATLIVRPRESWDNATPAGPSALADASLRLFGLTGDGVHRDRGESIVRSGAAAIRRNPLGYGELLRAGERLLAGPREVAIIGPDAARLVRAYHAGWHPGSVLAVAEAPTDRPPLLASRTPVDGHAAAYVCRSFTCDRPVTTPEELQAALAR